MKIHGIRRLLPALLLVAVWGCGGSDDGGPTDPGGGGGDTTTDKTCLGCHANETMLKDALGVTTKVAHTDYNKDDG